MKRYIQQFWFYVRRAGQSKKARLLIFAVFFAGIGTYILVRSFAATPPRVAALSKLPKNQQFISNEILIKLKPTGKDSIAHAKGLSTKQAISNLQLRNFNQLNQEYKVKNMEPLVTPSASSNASDPVFNWYKLTLSQPRQVVTQNSPAAKQVQSAIKAYSHDPNVETAQPNFVVKSFAMASKSDKTPNDPYLYSSGTWGQSYADQWDMNKIGMSTAWNTTKGSADMVVADIDTGLDYNNPDITANLWTNPKETAGNGVDDDKNGYADDVHGWNFTASNNDVMDRFGHGTHTAGTIGAVTNNNAGMAGMNWQVKIMPVKVLDDNGNGTYDGIVKGLVYAADNGAKVSNNSYGGYGTITNNAINDAVDYEHNKGMVVVASAGNNAAETEYTSPANDDNAITVAASGVEDQIACFSNWGEKIDVAAPGGDASQCGGNDEYTLSTRSATASTELPIAGTDSNFAIARGTSMAGPHVTGLAALLLAKNPALSPEVVRQIIRQSADDLGAKGQDQKYGFGRINAAKALATDPLSIIAPYITSPTSGSTLSGTAQPIMGSAAGLNFSFYVLDVAKYDEATQSTGPWQTITTSGTHVTNGTLGTIVSSKYTDGTYQLRLRVVNTSGQVFQAEKYYLVIKNFDAQIISPVYQISKGKNTINGTAQVVGNGLQFFAYKLEWGSGQNPSTWSTTGITNEHIAQPTNLVGAAMNSYGGPLGVLDTSSFTDGQIYTLRLTVAATNGATAVYDEHVKVDKDIRAGWPQSVCSNSDSTSFNCSSSYQAPVMADLDGDGQLDIAFFGTDNMIFAYHQDGTALSGFPYQIPSNQFVGAGYNYQNLTAADLNKDGKAELIYSSQQVFCSSGNCYTSSYWQINVLTGNGTPMAGWNPPVYYSSSMPVYMSTTPAVADINGDGKPEVIMFDRPALQSDPIGGMFTNTSRMNVYNSSGAELSGFPVTFTNNVPPGSVDCSSGICFYQFPDDAYTPPVVISDPTDSTKSDVLWSISNQQFMFDRTGHIMPGWPYTASNNADGTRQVFDYKATVADLDGTGQKKIVAVAYKEEELFDQAQIYVLNPNGTLVAGWPKPISPSWPGSSFGPTVTDINGDGKEDILAVDKVVTDDTHFYWRVKAYLGGGLSDDNLHTSMLSNGVVGNNDIDTWPIAFDYNGDGKIEFLADDTAGSYTYNGITHLSGLHVTNALGQNLWSKLWPLDNYDRYDSPSNIGTPVESSLLNNNQAQIAQPVDLSSTQSFYNHNYSIYVWNLPPGTNGTLKTTWPMLDHDALNSSRPK